MRWERTIPRVCLICGRAFLASEDQVWNRDAGKYCSRPCFHRGLGAERASSYRDRFWSKVNRDGPLPERAPELGPCWLWTSARHRQGYGLTTFKGRVRLTHIIAYALRWGAEPPRQTPFILHRCHNGYLGCVRPSHLKAGTQRQNVQQWHDTHPANAVRGERASMAKLTAQQVVAMRDRFAAGGATFSELGRAAGISPQAARKVILRTSWRHLP